MSDFWDNLARENTPPQQPRPQGKPWWMATAQNPVPANAQPTPAFQQRDETAEIVDASTKHAQMYRSRNELCPGCGSENYVSLGRVPNERGGFENKKCFDCDYPMVHTGVPGAGISSTARNMARQTAAGGSVKNNYHPDVVVSRLS